MRTTTATKTGAITLTKLAVATTALALTGGLALVTLPVKSTTKPVFTCVDDDGGSVPEVKGTVTLTNKKTKKKTIVRDTCLNSKMVYEATCKSKSGTGAIHAVHPIPCASGVCSKGACTRVVSESWTSTPAVGTTTQR